MDDFPDFMKRPVNKIATSSQVTLGLVAKPQLPQASAGRPLLSPALGRSGRAEPKAGECFA
jgi:hypothetical protein